jgi:putative transposase
LKEHETVVSVASSHRAVFSDGRTYKWKAKYGAMEISKAKRLRTLEDENTWLKRLRRRHAGQCGVEGPFGREVVTPAAERKAVAHLREAFEMRERRRCKAIGSRRMTVRYRAKRAMPFPASP